MDLIVSWTPKALNNYEKILQYLSAHWSGREVTNFIARTNEVVNLIASQPHLYRSSKIKGIRSAFITRHNLLFYKLHKNQLILLDFWDTRKDPSKNKF